MGESTTNIPCFQQSVSFGRFEHDSLCWERWSTFPTNKYLEEVEKCSTLGSVAQKKAYFEAHYKQIAARRAELLLDEERQMKAESENYEMSSTCYTNKDELDDKEVDTDNYVGETDQQENEVCNFDGDVSVDHVHVKIDHVGAFNEENEMDSFDGEVSVVHVHVKSNSDDGLNQDNEMGSFDGEVSVVHVHVHVKSNSDDGLNQDNEMGSFDGDVNTVSIDGFKQENGVGDISMLNKENELNHFDGNVKTDSADGFKQENEVWDIPDEMSAPNDAALTVNDISEVSNVINENCEDVNEFKDSDNSIDEASEVVKIEVLKDIPELKAGTDVIHEVVKSEVTENFDKPGDGDLMFLGTYKRPKEEIASAELYLTPGISEFGNLKESASVTGGLPSTPESKAEKLPQEKVKGMIVEEESGNRMKLVNSKTMPKATLVKKIASPTVPKKKSASPVPKRTSSLMPKSPMISTLKSSKPELNKAVKSASRALDKKENGFTSPTIKKTVEAQNKRVVPTSLHMSLSLRPINSDPSSLTMGKSLIMERMGDKDIVKRAFKAFQNPPQILPSSAAKSPATNQSTPRRTEVKGSPANTLAKKNEGIGRTAKTTNTHTGQQGTRKTLLSPGVKKNGGTDPRNVTSVAASFGPRVQLEGNNRKEDSKKLELKARANVFEATQLQSKLKVEKATEVKKSSQSINSKPKHSSGYSNRQGVPVHKDDGKSQTSG